MKGWLARDDDLLHSASHSLSLAFRTMPNVVSKPVTYLDLPDETWQQILDLVRGGHEADPLKLVEVDHFFFYNGNEFERAIEESSRDLAKLRCV